MVGVRRLLLRRPRHLGPSGWWACESRMGRRWPRWRGRVRTTRVTTDASVHAIPRATRGDPELKVAGLGQCSGMTPETEGCVRADGGARSGRRNAQETRHERHPGRSPFSPSRRRSRRGSAHGRRGRVGIPARGGSRLSGVLLRPPFVPVSRGLPAEQFTRRSMASVAHSGRRQLDNARLGQCPEISLEAVAAERGLSSNVPA